MGNRPIDIYYVWKSPAFQALFKHVNKPTLSDKEEALSGDELLNWLDKYDGAYDGMISSSCIPDIELDPKIGGLWTTTDKKDAVKDELRKRLPDCKEMLVAEIRPEMEKGPAIEAAKPLKPGHTLVPVKVKTGKIGGKPFMLAGNIYERAVKKAEELYSDKNQALKSFVPEVFTTVKAVETISSPITASFILLLGGAFATGLTPQSFQQDLNLIQPVIEDDGDFTVMVEVPIPGFSSGPQKPDSDEDDDSDITDVPQIPAPAQPKKDNEEDMITKEYWDIKDGCDKALFKMLVDRNSKLGLWHFRAMHWLIVHLKAALPTRNMICPEKHKKFFPTEESCFSLAEFALKLYDDAEIDTDAVTIAKRFNNTIFLNLPVERPRDIWCQSIH